MLLDYMATYPNSLIYYKASDMVLHVDSDAEYITMSGARSCYAGYFYLSDWPSMRLVKTTSKRNGPIHTKCIIMNNVVSSAAEAEVCSNFRNGKTAINMKLSLITVDHKQPDINQKTDNSTTERFVNSGIELKHSKTRDIKCQWLRDK